MSNGDGDPATVGEWLEPVQTPGYSTDPDSPDGVFAVHAALLHTGRVLFFSGYFEGQGYSYRSWEFDPATVVDALEAGDGPDQAAEAVRDDAIGRWFVPGFEDDAEGPGIDDDLDIDLFCSHHVQLDDGRILVVGGDAVERKGSRRVFHDNRGLRIYDPRASRWTPIPHRMAAGRWYPTAVTLPDGRVAIFSGDSAAGAARDDWPGDDADLHFFDTNFADVEIVGPYQFDPTIVSGGNRGLYVYPGLVLVQGGRIYSLPTTWDDGTRMDALETRYFQLTGETAGTWNTVDARGRHPTDPRRQEGTFVLLPPASDGQILVIGGYDPAAGPDAKALDSCEILETRDGEEWVPAGRMHHRRANVSAVILPTAEVLIVGGHDSDPGNEEDDEQPQMTPEIYDPTVTYDPADETAAFTKVADMARPRMYHSTIILLPDGHVLTAGGYGDAHHGGGPADQREMELYKPPYMSIDGERPEILDVSGQGPDGDETRYGSELVVEYETPAGDEIETVALMRPCTNTHHTDTDQRYEDVPILSDDGNRIRVPVPADPSILPPGYYMVWLVDTQGRPCKRAEFVRVSQRSCTLVTDRSHFSAQAYGAEATTLDDTVEFRHALYLIVHGFAPEELGITTTDPTDEEVPDLVVREDGTGLSEVTASLEEDGMHLQDPDDRLDVRQRITFEYRINVHDADAFPSGDGTETAERVLQVTSDVEGFTCEGRIVLIDSLNPYMLDGDPHWLSKDVRVFQVREGEEGGVAGVELTPDQTQFEYLQAFLQACRDAPPGEGNPFSMLPRKAEDAKLELAEEVDGARVLNFAVARVRLKAPGDVEADDVHVFFRLFVTEQPTLPYHDRAYPKSEGSRAFAQVGQTDEEVLTIPFYATPRAEMGEGAGDGDEPGYDDPNIQDISGEGADTAVRYYGAWLDINDPDTEPLTDPVTGEDQPVLHYIRGRHQCMVGEVFFESDEIPADATPADHDNLSQRNLAIVDSDNPGGPDAHTVVHTFNVVPTWSKDLSQELSLTHIAARAPTAAAGRREWTPGELRPDELAIFWGDVPRDAEATLYFPTLDADEIVELARQEGRAGVPERVGPHTIRCPVADVSYVPLPAPARTDLAGLITVEMPDHVTTGETYRVVVRHCSRLKGRMEGSFELLVPVKEAEDFRSEAERTLAIFRHIAQTLPGESRWRPIFQRYLQGLRDRAAGAGADPQSIGPSPTGATPAAERPSDGDGLVDLVACLLERGALDDLLDEHQVDPEDLRACLGLGPGPDTADPRLAQRGRTPLGTTCRTGEQCPESGVWNVVGEDETASIAEGDTFPPYDGEGVGWKLLQHA